MDLGDYRKFTEISMIFSFSVYLFNPILSPYIKSLGFTNLQTSLIFSILPISIIIFSPIMGKLSYLVGRRKIIMIGIIIEILAIFLYIFDTSWIFISLARILDAFGATTVSLITFAKIEDSLDNKKRGEYSGWSLSIGYVGKLAGPILGGLLADYFFIKAPFYISSVILLGLIFFLFQKDKKRKYKIDRKMLNPLNEIKNFLSFRKLRGMAILGMAMHAVNPAISVFLPLLIIEDLGMSISFIGYAFFFMGIAHLIQFEFGKLSDKHKPWKIVVLGCILSALGLGFVSISKNFIILITFLFIMGIGNSMWNVSAWDLMSNVGEKSKDEGEILTSYISMAKIGSFASFILSGLIVSMFGLRVIFILNSIVVLIAVIFAINFFRD